MHGAIWRKASHELSDAEKEDDEGSTWLSLPEKSHLAILFTSRLFDFVQIIAIQTYVLDQLKSFDGLISDSKASQQVGLLNGSFTAAQALTSLLWGRLSDVAGVGRRPVFLIGLLGSVMACIGFGFSQSFLQALFCRIIGGAINGNGGIRYVDFLKRVELWLRLPLSITMTAESLKDKREIQVYCN
jgi:MFS family permease